MEVFVGKVDLLYLVVVLSQIGKAYSDVDNNHHVLDNVHIVYHTHNPILFQNINFYL